MGLTDTDAAKMARALQTEWSETNEIRATRRQLRQRKLDPPLPPGWSKNVHIKHRTYEIDDAVRVLRNRLLAANVSILVFAKSGEAKAQQAASRIRRFLDKLWIDFNCGYPSAQFLGTDSQVADGVWCAHLVWNQDWIDKGLEADDIDAYLKDAGVPFTLETPDALNVFVEFDRLKMPRRVVTIESLPVHDLLNKRYTDGKGDEYSLTYDKHSGIDRTAEPKTYDDLWDGGFAETVEIASVEDSGFVHRVLLNAHTPTGEKDFGLGKWDNLFKRPAWVFMAGDFSNSTDPLERWKPLVLGMLSMGQEVNMLRSARLNSGVMAGLWRLAFRPQADKGLGPVGDKPKPELTFNEDGTVSWPDGWDVGPFEFPTDAAQLLDRAVASVEDELVRYKPAPALRGVREEGVSSGYQQALIAEAAMTDLDPPLAIQSQGIKDILYLVLDGAKAISEVTDGKIDTLYVRTLNQGRTEEGGNTAEVLSLKADEIDDFEITVRQSSMSPTSRIAMWEEGRRARAAGEIDDIEMYESFFGYEDGIEMQRRATEQKMYDAQIDQAIVIASQIVAQKVAARQPPAPPTILGPNGEPLAGSLTPPQAGGVPTGSAAPGMDATLNQPRPPVPAAVPLGPSGGQAGMGGVV
jgi:hypothetical protein